MYSGLGDTRGTPLTLRIRDDSVTVEQSSGDGEGKQRVDTREVFPLFLGSAMRGETREGVEGGGGRKGEEGEHDKIRERRTLTIDDELGSVSTRKLYPRLLSKLHRDNQYQKRDNVGSSNKGVIAL